MAEYAPPPPPSGAHFSGPEWYFTMDIMHECMNDRYYALLVCLECLAAFSCCHLIHNLKMNSFLGSPDVAEENLWTTPSKLLSLVPFWYFSHSSQACEPPQKILIVISPHIHLWHSPLFVSRHMTTYPYAHCTATSVTIIWRRSLCTSRMVLSWGVAGRVKASHPGVGGHRYSSTPRMSSRDCVESWPPREGKLFRKLNLCCRLVYGGYFIFRWMSALHSTVLTFHPVHSSKLNTSFLPIENGQSSKMFEHRSIIRYCIILAGVQWFASLRN